MKNHDENVPLTTLERAQHSKYAKTSSIWIGQRKSEPGDRGNGREAECFQAFATEAAAGSIEGLPAEGSGDQRRVGSLEASITNNDGRPIYFQCERGHAVLKAKEREKHVKAYSQKARTPSKAEASSASKTKVAVLTPSPLLTCASPGSAPSAPGKWSKDALTQKRGILEMESDMTWHKR